MATDFLVELGTEELPPKALWHLASAFEQGVSQGLTKAGLTFSASKAFASPRRLAVYVTALAEQTPVQEQAIWGPPAAIAFDKDGNPTKAAEAFAKKNGVDISELKTENDGKADKLICRKQAGGEAAQTLLPAIVEQALTALPIAKRMRWGASRTEFVRPAHWLIMLLGSEIVDAEILGLRANRETRGHRFHYNQTLIINEPSEYVEKLLNPGYVQVDYIARRELIQQQVNEQAASIDGQAVIDPDLLDEVTALVEWPVALTGRFEERFLDVPAEALIASMKEHQKYFHVEDSNGKLMPNFITVANIVSTDPQQVIDGNERVIRPRLSDAAFFFETDKKVTLESLRDNLKNIVFQAQLGTLFEKTERVSALAGLLADKINANKADAVRAGQLCKSDLVTNMVGEFDNMQGIAGYYYALNDGESNDVALALNEQYMPRFAGDQLPTTMTGTLVALADRLDTLVGIFGIGQLPTGSKDPFALRRASLGVLRLLVEKELDLDLAELLDLAIQQHKPLPKAEGLKQQVLNYVLDRFRAGYEDDNIAVEVFMAVMAKQLSNPLDINRRVQAVHQFSQLPQAQALAAANKRVSNILAKQEGTASTNIDTALLQETDEKALAAKLLAKSEQVAPLFTSHSYTEALQALAELQQPVDAFFDNIMVMTDDEAVRNNRIALLNQLRGLFLEVADISLLVPAKNA